MAEAGRIRVGIGGWTYAPWRETFYPEEVKHKDELAYASRQLSAIEVNGTFYRLQKPDTFARWADETPDDFVFSLKAPRYAMTRRDLGSAGEAIERFLASGLDRLGAKLGPLLWQFPPTKRFDADELERFLALLPTTLEDRRLRHVIELRHPSFMTPAALALARRYKVATVYTDSAEHPSFADLTADFAYLRLMRARAQRKTGYTAPALRRCAAWARTWAAGAEPADLPRVEQPVATGRPRDVFIYFINGAKERAPGAAQALLSLLRKGGDS